MIFTLSINFKWPYSLEIQQPSSSATLTLLQRQNHSFIQYSNVYLPMLKMWNRYKQQFAPNIRILASIIYCSEIKVSKALSNFTLGWIMWMKSRVISLKKRNNYFFYWNDLEICWSVCSNLSRDKLFKRFEKFLTITIFLMLMFYTHTHTQNF